MAAAQNIVIVGGGIGGPLLAFGASGALPMAKNGDHTTSPRANSAARRIAAMLAA